VVGLMLLLGVRRAQPTDQNFLDAAIVAAGLAIVAWAFLFEPWLSKSPPAGGYTGVAVCFGTLDLLLLALAVRVVLNPTSRTPTMLLLAAGAGVVFVADLTSIVRVSTHGLAGFQSGALVFTARSAGCSSRRPRYTRRTAGATAARTAAPRTPCPAPDSSPLW